MFTYYRTTHSPDNADITVERRGRARTYAVEALKPAHAETLSMAAVREFLTAFSIAGEPLDQVREHKRERRGTYCALVRVN